MASDCHWSWVSFPFWREKKGSGVFSGKCYHLTEGWMSGPTFTPTEQVSVLEDALGANHNDCPPCSLLKIYSVCVACICPYIPTCQRSILGVFFYSLLYILRQDLSLSLKVRFRDPPTSASTPSGTGLLTCCYSRLLYGCWGSELTSLNFS